MRFQLTAARRRLGAAVVRVVAHLLFQLTAARRRLVDRYAVCAHAGRVSTHSRPKAAGRCLSHLPAIPAVSTHSRPKAAGLFLSKHWKTIVCFNSQPPEGGWRSRAAISLSFNCFNSQPPEGGWQIFQADFGRRQTVSTHSRPKAAGLQAINLTVIKHVSTHSRPKAAGHDNRNKIGFS